MDCKIHKRRSEDVQEENSTELKEKVVAINRVAKVVSDRKYHQTDLHLKSWNS